MPGFLTRRSFRSYMKRWPAISQMVNREIISRLHTLIVNKIAKEALDQLIDFNAVMYQETNLKEGVKICRELKLWTLFASTCRMADDLPTSPPGYVSTTHCIRPSNSAPHFRTEGKIHCHPRKKRQGRFLLELVPREEGPISVVSPANHNVFIAYLLPLSRSDTPSSPCPRLRGVSYTNHMRAVLGSSHLSRP